LKRKIKIATEKASKNEIKAGLCWLKPVMPATWEDHGSRSAQARPHHNQKKTKTGRGGWCLSSQQQWET
jgi:hypothetical protein